MLNSTSAEISKNIPFNLIPLNHIVRSFSVLKNYLDDRMNDASVLIYQKTLDINSQMWKLANIPIPRIDKKTVATGFLSIALMGMLAQTACALSSPERIQAQTVDLCTYEINDNHVLYEGGIVDLSGANIDQASGLGANLFLVNPFVVTGGRGKTQQPYLVVYHGDAFSPEQSFVPQTYATPQSACERVMGKIGSYDPNYGYSYTTEDGRKINAGALRIEKKKK